MTHHERMRTEEDAVVYLDERWCEQVEVGIELIELAERAIELHPRSARLLKMYGDFMRLGPDPNAEKSLAAEMASAAAGFSKLSSKTQPSSHHAST